MDFGPLNFVLRFLLRFSAVLMLAVERLTTVIILALRLLDREAGRQQRLAIVARVLSVLLNQSLIPASLNCGGPDF